MKEETINILEYNKQMMEEDLRKFMELFGD